MKKTHLAGFSVACVLAVILACAGVAESLRAQQPKQSNVIRVQTNLVTILASVIDAHGQPIPDLPQDVFELSEEGVPQKIERFEAETNRPLDLALMVDSSMSTYKDMKFETESAAHFVRQVVRPGDTLSVFEFDEKVTQLSDFSADVPKLQEAVRRISSGSGTSIYDAILLGSNSLRRRPGDRRRAIVVVTDAGETTSVSKFEDARRAAIASEALLYSIVLRPANESGRNTAGEHALITITDSTGGAMFLVDEMQQLDATFDRIDRELRTQYLLGYYPTPVPPPGSHRHVTLQVKSGDTVRYRKEYFTAAAPR
ncbi:MAG: VWA domain-containing protein [Candidatus Acidiferrales bacterium]|jgi:Ca-activated chloride channel family protein